MTSQDFALLKMNGNTIFLESNIMNMDSTTPASRPISAKMEVECLHSSTNDTKLPQDDLKTPKSPEMDDIRIVLNQILNTIVEAESEGQSDVFKGTESGIEETPTLSDPEKDKEEENETNSESGTELKYEGNENKETTIEKDSELLVQFPVRKKLKYDVPIVTASMVDNTVQERQESAPEPCNSKNSTRQISTPPPPSDNKLGPINELMELRTRVKEKEETLRQLKLLDFYQKQHSLEDLAALVDKWKQVAQAVATDLYESQKSNACEDLTLDEFLQKLDIDATVIGFK